MEYYIIIACRNMGESLKHNVRQKKLNKRVLQILFHLYKFQKWYKLIIGIELRMVTLG